MGGTKLAVELGATSADHLVMTPEADIIALGRGDTLAVGLPGTPFGLAHKEYTPARAILAAGGALALATDLNPGTTWCESMQMVVALACRYMGLTQAQAIVAATLKALIRCCAGDERPDCPILHTLEQPDISDNKPEARTGAVPRRARANAAGKKPCAH